MSCRPAKFIIPLLLLLLSCASSEHSKIEDVLKKRDEAFETSNVKLYASIISPHYEHKRGGKVLRFKDVINNFKGITVFFDKLKIDHTKRSIYVDDGRARVVQRTRVEVKMEKEGIKSRFTLIEKLELKKVGNRWFITKEADRDYAEGFVYGGS